MTTLSLAAAQVTLSKLVEPAVTTCERFEVTATASESRCCSASTTTLPRHTSARRFPSANRS